ncbi:MAG: hypothetical protein ACXAB2_01995, partial [Candidatus Hodarchaeales archaeon]
PLETLKKDSNVKMALPGIDATQYLNRYSTRAVSDFIQPRGTLDSLYMLFLAFWFGTSVLVTQEPVFRAGSFTLTIMFLIISNLERKWKDQKLFLTGSTLKLFLVSFFITFFVGTNIPDLDFELPFRMTYHTFETFILITVLLISILINSVRFFLLRKFGFSGYQAFIKSIIRGFWVISVGLYMLKAVDVLSESIPVYGSLWEDLLIMNLIVYLGVSLFPYSFNSLTNSISKRNSVVNFRDTLLGATLTLIVLEFIFHEFTNSFWNKILPLMLLTGSILFVVRDDTPPFIEAMYAKSLAKTREVADKLNNLNYSDPENIYITNKSMNLFNKGSSDFRAGKGTIIVPLGMSDEMVTVEALGDLSFTLKDSLGRLQKDPVEKATFMLSKKEWKAISKQMRSEKLQNVDITSLKTPISSLPDLKDDLTNSLTIYKNKFNTIGLNRIQENYDLVKGKYSKDVSREKKEFNFPGIKVIEEPGSQLFKFGSIEAIDVERKLPDDKKARIFNIKLPFVAATEIEHEGRYFALNMPFVSVLETPKGMTMNFLGFNVNEGDREAILEDLEHILTLQSKFHDYYQFRMSNFLALEQDPTFILTRKKGDDKEKLLVSGSDDSFYINEDQPLALPQVTQENETPSDEEIIDISEEEIEILAESQSIQKPKERLMFISEKVSKLQKRLDKIDKEDFIDFVGFKNNKEFLDWITSLPDDSTIRLEDKTIYFR